jgi:hypothetical protein
LEQILTGKVELEDEPNCLRTEKPERSLICLFLLYFRLCANLECFFNWVSPIQVMSKQN